MCLAKNLKYLRLKNNYSQDEISEKFGYKSYTTIQKWEMGIAEPSVDKLRKIAKLYNVSMNDLLTRDLEKDGNTFSEQLPSYFENAQEAMQFILRQPMVANYGGYDLDTMTDEEIIEMAEEVADMLKIMAKRHKKK